MKFNEEQLKVINFDKGNCAVIAGAGSGKSTCLVNRINRLVEKGVNEEDIVAITFTKNSAKDLKRKLEKSDIHNVCVGTFHSICIKILSRAGINFKIGMKEYEIENLFKKISDDRKIKYKDILSFISYQKNHMIGYDDEFVEFECDYLEEELRVFYREYERFKAENNYFDFDDLLLKAYEVLKSNKYIFNCQYLMVDEAQDNNLVQNKLLNLLCKDNNIMIVGDYKQCLIPTTKIQTIDGEKEIQDITINDELIVGAGRGEIATIKPEEVMKKQYNGKIIKITTESGKVIECTPNHGIFVNRLIKKPYVIYLMYRPGYGFRIGQSSNYKDKNREIVNGYEHRLTSENGERVWVIRVCETLEEACFYENHFAFKYGIPLYVYNQKGRRTALNQEKIKELFNSFDNIPRGMKLLEDLNMSFDTPHYIPKGNSKHVNVKISMNLFGSWVKSGGTKFGFTGYTHELAFSTINEDFAIQSKKILGGCVKQRKNGKGLKYFEGRKQSKDHDKLINEAYKLVDLNDKNKLIIKATLTNSLDRMELYPASNIRQGMDVAMYNGTEIINELVVNVETYDYNGLVYDINVPYYRNYIANNIVTHNCIYSFRGSKPEAFMSFDKLLKDCEIINLSKNYRSKENIVENANKFIKRYYGDYKHYSDSIANNKLNGDINYINTCSVEEEAIKVVDEIEKLIKNNTKLEEISVLYRLNSQSNYIENELKLRNIKYNIHNSSSFFKRKEIHMIMCVLRLIKNPSDDLAYEDLLKNRIIPFMPKTVIDNIITTASRLNISFLEASEIVNIKNYYLSRNVKEFSRNIDKLIRQQKSGVTLSTLVNNIINLINLYEWIENNYKSDEEIEERFETIENFKKFLRDNTLESFLIYVYEKSSKQKKDLTENAIQLMTLHGSKGLEFENVFIVGLNNEKFPNRKANLLDEARLMYVGITRAKSNLWLSTSESSVFIDEYRE